MTVPLQLRDVWDEFWAAPRLATLGTVRADGTPHLVPVRAILDGDELLVLTRAASVKARNVVRRPWAAVSELTPTTWCTVEGKAVVSEDADDLARGRAAYERRFGRDGWTGADCVVLVRIERVLGGGR
ncbi:pyridoxamine 5'-phosphate oxidase family protein [Nocardioides alkalitolerans]|uniref:pyridoxamine 5'-phosphate oxidase family protein n=1 Tax=Nocardioides alkalitolerans TaxID=281714 RepID=UPI0004100044|nr:pyridoxamine 5'-phosphate oxidase family protein [Nocardioides alkalitolerans]